MNYDKKTNLALGFMTGAYLDYIAARVLLNKDYTLQGAILASTAIEKSFKALLTICGGKAQRIHFDRFELLEKEIKSIGFGVVLEKIDSRFLYILSRVYRLRYFDNVKEIESIGFIKNQFIGELDGTMAYFENAYKFDHSEGEQVLSPLKTAYKNEVPDLIHNNWIYLKIPKEEFMNRDFDAFAISIHPEKYFEPVVANAKFSEMKYSGKMGYVNLVNGGSRRKTHGK